MDTTYLNKFYKKSLPEKLEALKNAKVISPEDFEQLKAETLKLPVEVASYFLLSNQVQESLVAGAVKG